MFIQKACVRHAKESYRVLSVKSFASCISAFLFKFLTTPFYLFVAPLFLINFFIVRVDPVILIRISSISAFLCRHFYTGFAKFRKSYTVNRWCPLLSMWYETDMEECFTFPRIYHFNLTFKRKQLPPHHRQQLSKPSRLIFVFEFYLWLQTDSKCVKSFAMSL